MTPNLTNNNSTGPGALSGPTMGANEREKQAKEKTPDKNTSIKGIKTFFFFYDRERQKERGGTCFSMGRSGKASATQERDQKQTDDMDLRWPVE